MADTLPIAEPRLRWFQGVPKYAWMVFGIAALGWMLDCMDQNLFNLVAQRSIGDLLQSVVPAAQLQAAVNSWRGWITFFFLVGWAVGGFIFGILGDKLGRARTMMITILIYAAFTGLCGIAQTPRQYCLFRFMTAMGVGGEFAAGVALIAEVFPDRSRPLALGALQALSALGNITAALVVLSIKDTQWRSVFFIGAVPALLVLWIWRSVKEPEKWQEAKNQSVEDVASKKLGDIAELFRDPILRRNTLAGVLLAVAGVGGMWGVGFWLPDLMSIAFKPLHLTPAAASDYRSYAFIIQNAGAFVGMFGFAVLSERIGRKPAMLLVFLSAFAAVQCTFWFVDSLTKAMIWAAILGICALAPFAAYCVYFPELYPTRLRTTGVGFCYNCARVFAAAAPLTLGKLSGTLALSYGDTLGFRMAASIVTFVYVFGLIGLMIAPETRGKPLPE